MREKTSTPQRERPFSGFFWCRRARAMRNANQSMMASDPATDAIPQTSSGSSRRSRLAGRSDPSRDGSEMNAMTPTRRPASASADHHQEDSERFDREPAGVTSASSSGNRELHALSPALARPGTASPLGYPPRT